MVSMFPIVSFAILFAAVYFSKRRFGLLGLALVAGWVLSGVMTSIVIKLLKSYDLAILQVPTEVLVPNILVLLPVFLLMLVGPKYHKKYERLLYSITFSALATYIMVITTMKFAPDFMKSPDILAQINPWQNYIIAFAIGLAVLDILLQYGLKKRRLKKSSH